ncbi:MAG: hypothetical protein AABY22_24055 [Nanoarchaeota archaeon]
MKKFKIREEIYHSFFNEEEECYYAFFPGKKQPSFRMKYDLKTASWQAYGVILRWVLGAEEIIEDLKIEKGEDE